MWWYDGMMMGWCDDVMTWWCDDVMMWCWCGDLYVFLMLCMMPFAFMMMSLPVLLYVLCGQNVSARLSRPGQIFMRNIYHKCVSVLQSLSLWHSSCSPRLLCQFLPRLPPLFAARWPWYEHDIWWRWQWQDVFCAVLHTVRCTVQPTAPAPALSMVISMMPTAD